MTRRASLVRDGREISDDDNDDGDDTAPDPGHDPPDNWPKYIRHPALSCSAVSTLRTEERVLSLPGKCAQNIVHQ